MSTSISSRHGLVDGLDSLGFYKIGKDAILSPDPEGNGLDIQTSWTKGKTMSTLWQTCFKNIGCQETKEVHSHCLII